MIRMNQYIWGLCAGLAWLFTACTQQEHIDGVDDNHNIVIHFDVPDAVSTRMAATITATEAREGLLQVIDVFVFAGSEDTPSDETEVLLHERVTGTGDDYILQADKRSYTDTYIVYVLANVPESAKAFLETVHTYEDLKNLKLEQDICNPYGDENYHFLMDGKSAPVTISNQDKIDVELKRAAAKVEVVLSLPTDWGTVPATDQFTWGTNLSSGYWVNPPKTSFLSAEKELQLGDNILYGSNSEDDNLKAIDHEYENGSKKRFVLYSYATIWQGGDFDHETYLILNLPIKIGDQEQAANYYKVRINQNTSGTLRIERNTYYKINITVGTKGSTTPDEAEELTGSVGVHDWVTNKIEIGGGDDTKFLVLSEEEIEFYNTETNQIVEYASSSDVTVSIKQQTVNGTTCAAFYYDQLGKQQPVSSQCTTNAFITDDGHILIKSDLLENAAPKHYTVVVTNAEGISKEFKVIQYPLEYITSTQGVQSYRTDFIGYNGKPATKDNPGNTTSTNYWFSKYVHEVDEDGMSVLRKYTWERRGNNQYEIKPAYVGESKSNARMYHVTITRTSNEYVLAIPDMDGEVTAGDEDNSKKVSPSFMIASRLGFINGSSVEYSWAVEHCKQYVEETKDENGTVYVYDDWRLPTETELNIITTFQNMENAVIPDLLNAEYYWAAGERRVEAGQGYVNEDEAAIRCVRDAYRNTEPQN